MLRGKSQILIIFSYVFVSTTYKLTNVKFWSEGGMDLGFPSFKYILFLFGNIFQIQNFMCERFGKTQTVYKMHSCILIVAMGLQIFLRV